jgi:hypothetical protein
MPWQSEKTYELNDARVLSAPPKSGVYGLLRPEAWVYIASTPNIQGALRNYLRGKMPWVAEQHPSFFAFELAPKLRRGERCSQLSGEFKPLFLDCI